MTFWFLPPKPWGSAFIHCVQPPSKLHLTSQTNPPLLPGGPASPPSPWQIPKKSKKNLQMHQSVQKNTLFPSPFKSFAHFFFVIWVKGQRFKKIEHFLNFFFKETSARPQNRICAWRFRLPDRRPPFRASHISQGEVHRVHQSTLASPPNQPCPGSVAWSLPLFRPSCPQGSTGVSETPWAMKGLDPPTRLPPHQADDRVPPIPPCGGPPGVQDGAGDAAGQPLPHRAPRPAGLLPVVQRLGRGPGGVEGPERPREVWTAWGGGRHLAGLSQKVGGRGEGQIGRGNYGCYVLDVAFGGLLVCRIHIFRIPFYTSLHSQCMISLYALFVSLPIIVTAKQCGSLSAPTRPQWWSRESPPS